MEQKHNDEKVERWEDVPSVTDQSVLGELSGKAIKLKETKLTLKEKITATPDAMELYPYYDGRITSGRTDDPLPLPRDWTNDDIDEEPNI